MWFEDLKRGLLSQRESVLRSIAAVAVFVLATEAGVAWPAPLALAISALILSRLGRRLTRVRHELDDATVRGALAVFLGLTFCLMLVIGERALMVVWSSWILANAALLLKWTELRDNRGETMRGWWPEPVRERWLDLQAGLLALLGGAALALAQGGDPAIWLVFVTFGENFLSALGLAIFAAINRSTDD